jgi:hypothetical protein
MTTRTVTGLYDSHDVAVGGNCYAAGATVMMTRQHAAPTKEATRSWVGGWQPAAKARLRHYACCMANQMSAVSTCIITSPPAGSSYRSQHELGVV